jgi:hypothetical protein
MDILAGLPKTKEGYQYILLVTDSFSHWAEAFPLKTQEAQEIADSCLGTLVFFLTKILKLFGFPILESKTSCTCVLGVSILPLLPFFYCISELF